MFNKKKENIIIIDTGQNLPAPSVEQEMRFMSERNRFLKVNIEKQTKQKNNIIYGCQAVNALVDKNYKRPTTDYDIYSHKPKNDAIELEKTIDNHVGANIAQVEQVNYDRDGVKGKMYRVALKNWDTVADYNPMPNKVSITKKHGINYESLKKAENKYIKMIKEKDFKRIINANQDLDRISLNNYWRKVF